MHNQLRHKSTRLSIFFNSHVLLSSFRRNQVGNGIHEFDWDSDLNTSITRLRVQFFTLRFWHEDRHSGLKFNLWLNHPLSFVFNKWPEITSSVSCTLPDLNTQIKRLITMTDCRKDLHSNVSCWIEFHIVIQDYCECCCRHEPSF